MCGQIPSGLQAYSAATDSQGPQTLYSLYKCPPWIDSTAASDAGTAATGRSMNIGAVVGGVVGGCAFLALVAAAVLVAVMTRRRRRKRHDDLLTVPYRHSSIDGKVRRQFHPRTTSKCSFFCAVLLISISLSVALYSVQVIVQHQSGMSTSAYSQRTAEPQCCVLNPRPRCVFCCNRLKP